MGTPKIVPLHAQAATSHPYGRGVQYLITLHVDLQTEEGKKLVCKLKELLARNPASALVFSDEVNTALVVCCTVQTPDDQTAIEDLLRRGLHAWFLWLQGQNITTWLARVVELVCQRPLIAIDTSPPFAKSA